MDKRTAQLQSMLNGYAQQILAPMRGHFDVLARHIDKDLVRRLAAGMLGAKLRLEAAERGTPLRADQMPDTMLMQQAADAAIWPTESRTAEAELPFNCAKLIGRDAAGAVRKLLKAQCGTRGRRRLPDGPLRAQGGSHG